MSTREHILELVNDAIESSPHEHIYDLLHFICGKSYIVLDAVAEILLVTMSEIDPFEDAVQKLEKERKYPGMVEDEPATESEPSSKRTWKIYVCKRWETCEVCDEEYDVSANTSGSCYRHSGEIEVDEHAATWDHLGRIAGPIDTPENRKKYCDGFRWTCCYQPSDDSDRCENGTYAPRDALSCDYTC
ncbi:uncharacterized protein BDZ99DRAFT_513758 [Mytilinidion resinicola]|uniref:Uncharacterized protein n=1 Tax=Mytilinidion resinicola TaxID=574789 RepID=A0A6A6ZBB6_9PEZI|nr:uncharacterized protein BDZ99DRAFT_513758 [Mytilinidion resinicola]KAF2817517.1 hypothetical protein BDZ99DRAFT_513758 [Mytilinidion resinicola]